MGACAGLAIGGFILGCGATANAPAQQASTQTPTTGTSTATTQTQAQTIASPATTFPQFDGTKALAEVQAECKFGVRPLGSDAHEKIKDYLIAQMKQYADKVDLQTFTYRGMTVTNIIGIFYPAGTTTPSKNPVLLLSHWDTRPIADGPNSDQDPTGFVYGSNGWNRTTPIMGADDGASSTAACLELARLFKQKHPSVGVVILLDDGEDYGDFRANGGDGEGIELGSRYFAKNYRSNPDFGHPQFGILLDMVGGDGIVIPREMQSQRYAGDVNDNVFATATGLGYGDVFRGDLQQDINDDHIAVNQAGIPTIDLIQPLPGFGDNTNAYKYWHTLQDTPDKVSAKSLEIVGKTVAAVLYNQTRGK